MRKYLITLDVTHLYINFLLQILRQRLRQIPGEHIVPLWGARQTPLPPPVLQIFPLPPPRGAPSVHGGGASEGGHHHGLVHQRASGGAHLGSWGATHPPVVRDHPHARHEAHLRATKILKKKKNREKSNKNENKIGQMSLVVRYNVMFLAIIIVAK